MNSLDINIINDDEHPIISEEKLLECFTLVSEYLEIVDTSVNVNIVSNNEIQEVNNQYRNKNKPTNIISFPFEKPEGLPDDIMNDFLGDIIIAPDVLKSEALEQDKSLENHWCHIFIHGLLHLAGYDHQTDEDAKIMENIEINILNKMNIQNPYI